MSLIQQALEKTNRAYETRTTTPVQTPKVWGEDPMGGHLEQELVRVQEAYAKRRKLYWRVIVGVMAVLFIAVLFYAGMQGRDPKRKILALTKRPATVVVSPVRISSGSIYRLTGITDLGGNPIAVINERLVGVGDILEGGAAVKAIGDGAVLLEVRGKEIHLTL